MFLLFVMFLSADLARLLAMVARRIAAQRHASIWRRRTFISRLTATLVAVFAIAAGTVAVRSALAQVRVRRLRVRLDRLPRVHNGLRIVQLTDIHVGPTIGRAFIEDIVRRTNALGARHRRDHRRSRRRKRARAPHAVAPLGGPARAPRRILRYRQSRVFFRRRGVVGELARIGIRVLRNERVLIGEGADALRPGGRR